MSDAQLIDTPAGPAQLRRSERKTLAITVHPDGALELVAPMGAPMTTILAKVQRRLSWIRRQRTQFAGMNANRTSRRYCTGATHRYLGRQYRLRIEQGTPPSVKLKGAFIVVTACKDDDVPEMVGGWFKTRAQHIFPSRVRRWADWCTGQKLPTPRLRLRAMKKRWGSARQDGVIQLNPDLVRAPSICIDYVIAHEICHLRHPHHGPEFYRLLSSILPGWQAVKNRLEQMEL